ncbi:hypothetical protein [Streptomyces sp. NPDC059991]|uniref:hypothetical protein n=1 Tax=unclassified Streptomyces TaxID=2593676 RepID=UPI00368DE33A
MVADLTALITGYSSGTSSSGCAWVLSYDSRTYEHPWPPGISVKDNVRHQGPALGMGTLKGCADGGTEHEQTVAVFQIPGVPTEQAVISQDNVIGLTDPHHIPTGVRDLLNVPSSSPP